MPGALFDIGAADRGVALAARPGRRITLRRRGRRRQHARLGDGT
jgi:hypothetical protein